MASRPMLGAAMAAAVVALCGCAGAPPPPASSLPPIPQRFAAAAPQASTAQPPQPAWWHAFADPELDALMARADSASPTLAVAAARLAQARALLLDSQAARGPQLTLSGGASRQGGPLLNAAGASGTLITAGASVSYDFDLFGRLSHGADAAALDVRAQEQAWRAARLALQAELAQALLALRALDAERVTLRQADQAWRDSVELTEQRWRAGSVAEVQVLRLRAELADNQAEAATLARRRAELQSAVALLIGELPSGFRVPEAAAPEHVPPPPEVPAGLPSGMLERRPDVAAAQSRWAAAQARQGATRSAWFPSLALTASGGRAAPGLQELLQASTRAWGLGLLAALPLIDGGRRDAAVQRVDAQADIEFANYRAQILLAFKEVEDQLVALEGAREQATLGAQVHAASLRALAAVESRRQRGLGSQLEWLDARRLALRNERRLLQVQASQAQLTVGLIRALGGGWQE